MPARPSPLRVEPLEDRSTPAVIVPHDFYSPGNEPAVPPPFLVGVTVPAFAVQQPPGYVPPPSSTITIPRPIPPASEMKRVGGISFHDRDRDGTRDASEWWGAGVRLYLDRNQNGRWDSSEPIRRTNPDGTYDFRDQFVHGTNLVRALVPRTWRGPLPAPDEHRIAAFPPNFVGPLPPSIPDPRVVLASPPALPIGSDGTLIPLPPTGQSSGTRAVDWSRVL